MKKRVISLMMTLVMLLGCFPVSAFATEADQLLDDMGVVPETGYEQLTDSTMDDDPAVDSAMGVDPNKAENDPADNVDPDMGIVGEEEEVDPQMGVDPQAEQEAQRGTSFIGRLLSLLGLEKAVKAEISTQAELKAALEEGTGSYTLVNDITVTAWETVTKEFAGTLDGQGHQITGLTYDSTNPGRTGMLLNSIGKAGVVKNLTIVGASVENADERVNVGILAGTNEGTVENVHVKDSGVYAGKYSNVGGIIGLNKGTVTQCSNLGGAQGVYKARGGQAGGIVGRNQGGFVDQCFNVDAVSSASGAMHGEGFAGGIVGSNGEMGTVAHSYNRGTISKGTMNSGGIVGSNTSVDGGADGLCINTFHAGKVMGGGNNVVTTRYGYTSNNWYDDANGDVGHVGKSDKYSPENDNALKAALNVHSNFFTIDGGKLKLTWETGEQPAAVPAVNKTELNNTLVGASGLTQESGPYTDASWLTFLTAQKNAKLANAYPYATAEQVAKVTTALNDAYIGLQKEEASKPDTGLTWTEVGTAEALKAALLAGGGIKLTADITLPSDWLTDGYKPFTLEGAGHTITLSGRSFIVTTMFGTFTESNLYQDCTIANVVFAGEVKGGELNGFGGAVAGTSEGIIHNCINLAAVTVDSMSNAGGLVGVNKGTIENCVGYGAVTGANLNNGALAGNNIGTLTNSYAADALATPEQQNAAVEALNAALTEGDQQWSVSAGKLTFGAAEPPAPEVTYDHQAATEQELKDAIKAGGSTLLTADITLTKSLKLGIFADSFFLEGAGHTITLSGAPLFGDIGFNCTVQNLVLAGTVNGRGAIAANNMGTIRNCINRAAVTGITAGGLVGVNNGTIENCVNDGTVTMAEDPDGLPNYVGSLAGELPARDGVVLTGCYGSGEKLLGKGTADATNHLLTAETDLTAAAADLNSHLQPGDIQWKVEGGKLALATENMGGTEPEKPDVPAVEVIEIANETELYNALADLWNDPSMETQKDKKLVITADFAVKTPVNRMPNRGLNTVLDGQGHTITLTGALSLIDEIGANGVVKNLGIQGSIKGDGAGAITNKSAGTIANCWSTVKIERTTAGAIGGLVGELMATGVIDNCYVAVEAEGLMAKPAQMANGDTRRRVGPLVGNAYEGCTIVNSYWAENMAKDGNQVNTPYFAHMNEYLEDIPYAAPGCSVKTSAELKSAEFLALLNQNKGENYSWMTGTAGLPVHGEAAPQPSVNKDALKAKLAEVKDLNKADYTAESWDTFAKAKLAATTVVASADATQEMVDKALTQLTQAHAELVKKPAELTVVEIANQQQLDAAMYDAFEGNTDIHNGKKLVITADFTITGTFRMPKGLNTILDGQGHTITLDGALPLVDEIASKGEIRNLGLTGTVSSGEITGAFTNKSSGRIVNCWSTANVKNTASATVGGFVGTLMAGGSIENSFVAADLLKGKNVGALVGTVNPGSTITNCYWKQGNGDNVYFRALDDMNFPVDYAGATGCAVKTDDELKSADFLALLNANKGDNMQWNRSASGLPYFGENIVPVEIVEIANQQQLDAAMYDAFEGNTDIHNGKKLVITADFTITGTFRMPKGLNTILDGQGHTITLDGALPLVDEIASKGEIRNLGLTGTVSSGEITGAFTNKSSGRIVNCWSTANVKNTASATVGGFVGTLMAGGSIENSFVAADLLKGKNVGALVGTVNPGSTITNCYWKQGNGENVYFRALDDMNFPVDYAGATGCSVKTDTELKSADFLALLNQNRGSNAEWQVGPNGYPHLGEASSVDPTQGIDVTLTFANGAEPVVFNTATGLNLTTLDILGMDRKVGTLSCEGGAHWVIDYDTYGKDIMVSDAGELFIDKPATTKITVSNSAWEKIATFAVVVTDTKIHAIRMTAEQGEMVNGVLTVPGRTTINFVPQIQETEGGEWKNANSLQFTFTAPLENAEVVGGSVSPIKPGKFTVTVSGMGKTATQEVESIYAPITAIKPAPSGEYTIHGRQAMVFEKKADFLDLNLSHQTGTVLITPSYATNQGKDAYAFSFSDPKVADYMADFVMGIRPLRAGETDITVTTLKEEKNVSGTTHVSFNYQNPLKSIEIAPEIEAQNGIKTDLPIKLTGTLNPEEWHITEPEIDWTYESTDGGEIIIARDGQSIQSKLGVAEGPDSEFNLYYASDRFTIEGVHNGTVKVTGTPWDTTGGAKPITFTVKVTGEEGPAVDYVQMAKDDAKIAGDWIINNQKGNYGYNSEWEIFSLLRNGRTIAEAGIDVEAYLDSIAAAIKDPENAKIMKKPTEMARLILAVTVLGKDATDVRGINLIDLITKSKDADMMAGSNESVWTLIALDTIGYEVPADAKWTREALIKEILRFEVKTGGFGLFSSEKAGIDTTGMALQALAPYYHKGNDAVDTAVDNSLSYLSAAKDATCGYGNSESTAQVLTALAALKIDPLNASNGFTVGRKNLISNLNEYRTADGGFAHMLHSGANGMAAYQVLYSLEAFLRDTEYRAPLYDLSDIKGGDPIKPTDPEAIDVIEKINAIGKVTLASEAAIKEARAAYDKLTPEQQKQVTNLYALTFAEKKLEELKNEKPGGGEVTPPADTIDVTFRLIGATKASTDVDLSTGTTGGSVYQNWIQTTEYTLDKGSMVYDLFDMALEDAGLKYKIRDKNNYVYGIQAPEALGGQMMEEFTNGRFSGWMYMVNGKHVSMGLSEQKLKDGDVVIWHYVNDFRYEIEDWFEGSLGDKDTWVDYDALPDTKPGEKEPGIEDEELPEINGQKMNFTDVKTNDWFHDAVAYVYEKGIMKGVTETSFAPQRTTTRGMIVTMLWRMAGEPKAKNTASFTDVPANAYCTKAVAWAAENGIVKGFEDGTFAPNAPISRQQMAAILYRYASFMKYSTKGAADLSKFADADMIAAYAEAPLAWANANGLINGREDNTLAPQGSATRAHVAAILMRFCEKYTK